MRVSPYRAVAAPIIKGVLAAVGRDDLVALRDALRKACPFSTQQSWPRVVWRDEIARIVGTTQPKNLTRREHEAMGDLFDA